MCNNLLRKTTITIVIGTSLLSSIWFCIGIIHDTQKANKNKCFTSQLIPSIFIVFKETLYVHPLHVLIMQIIKNVIGVLECIYFATLLFITFFIINASRLYIIIYKSFSNFKNFITTYTMKMNKKMYNVLSLFCIYISSHWERFPSLKKEL